jgi:hypothetical protein
MGIGFGESSPFMAASFRLVKYHNLPRIFVSYWVSDISNEYHLFHRYLYLLGINRLTIGILSSKLT